VELYVMRHGEAEPASAGGTDAERQLSPQGKADVEAVARTLARAGVKPQAIFTSPLIRARQTGEIVSRVLGIAAEAAEALAPGCRLGAVQSLMEGGGLERVLLVGHEPDCSTIVRALIGGGQVRMKTSAVAGVEGESLAPAEGRLRWLLTPELARSGEGRG